MSVSLAESYTCCQRLARGAASSFYYAFYLLPRARRRSMCALYAFLRKTDDLGDSHEPVEMRRAALARWRQSLEAAFHQEADDPILPALVDTVRRYQIPFSYLDEVIDGVAMDLDERRYETFAELEHYCHRVASVVGLACIHIWGFRGQEAIKPAEQCGLAFQLTNILRDLKEDADRGRVYLPLEDLNACGYTEEDLLAGVCDERFAAVVALEIDRAEQCYVEAAGLEPYLDPVGRPAFGAMLATYHRLLKEIRRRPSDLFTRRIHLGAWQKLRIAGGFMLARPNLQRLVTRSATRVALRGGSR